MQQARPKITPDYRKVGVPEIDNNPLLAHLRLPPETDTDAFLALGLGANFDPNERELPTSIRRLRVNRLRRFFVPVLPVHRRALIDISSQMFDSYSARNPMTPEGGRFCMEDLPTHLTAQPYPSLLDTLGWESRLSWTGYLPIPAIRFTDTKIQAA